MPKRTLSSSNGPHPIDLHVGRRLRELRLLRGMSQSDLGKCVGVTFQQIQKYERGTNRVSASTLYEFATQLAVSVAFFYDGLSLIKEGEDHSSDLERRSYVSSKEGLHLIDAFRQLPARLRKPVLDLLDSMGGEDKAVESESAAG